MNYNYLIYSVFLLFVYNLNLSKNKYIVNLTLILLVLSYLKHIIDYPEDITINKGWREITFVKQIFLYIAIGLFLTKSSILNNKAMFQLLIFLSLIFMYLVPIFPHTWDYSQNKWTNTIHHSNIYIALFALFSMYSIYRVKDLSYVNGKTKGLTYSWIILQNILLTISYSDNAWKEGNTSSLFILSLWLPLLFYSKNEYFDFRSFGIAIPNIWKSLDPNSFNKIWGKEENKVNNL